MDSRTRSVVTADSYGFTVSCLLEPRDRHRAQGLNQPQSRIYSRGRPRIRRGPGRRGAHRRRSGPPAATQGTHCSHTRGTWCLLSDSQSASSHIDSPRDTPEPHSRTDRQFGCRHFARVAPAPRRRILSASRSHCAPVPRAEGCHRPSQHEVKYYA